MADSCAPRIHETPKARLAACSHDAEGPSMAPASLPNPFGRAAPQHLTPGADAKSLMSRLPGGELWP